MKKQIKGGNGIQNIYITFHDPDGFGDDVFVKGAVSLEKKKQIQDLISDIKNQIRKFNKDNFEE